MGHYRDEKLTLQRRVAELEEELAERDEELAELDADADEGRDAKRELARTKKALRGETARADRAQETIADLEAANTKLEERLKLPSDARSANITAVGIAGGAIAGAILGGVFFGAPMAVLLVAGGILTGAIVGVGYASSTGRPAPSAEDDALEEETRERAQRRRRARVRVETERRDVKVRARAQRPKRRPKKRRR